MLKATGGLNVNIPVENIPLLGRTVSFSTAASLELRNFEDLKNLPISTAFA